MFRTLSRASRARLVAVLRPLVPRVVPAALFCLALAAPAAVLAQSFPIRPGDTLRLSILGLPNSEVDTTVDAEGYLNLAWPGRVRAADRMLSEIIEEVRQLSEGRVFKRYTPEGLLKLIQIEAEDISLEVIAYRPVIVSGDVARPGEVPFRPGVTARGAIAVAGGVRSSLLADLSIADPAQIVRWQNEYARAALDHATALARRWRTTAEIEGLAEPQPIDPQQVAVSREVLATLTNEQLRLMEMRLQTQDGDRTYLEQALSQAGERLEILTAQRANQQEALDSDEAEEQRTQDLVSRSLVPATRLSEVRRNTVLSASRLLDLENQLAAGRLEVTRLEREIAAYDENRLTELLTLREQLSAAVVEARLRMDLLTQNLSGVVDGEGTAAAMLSSDVVIRAYRRDGETIRPVVVEMDSELQPGDTLEVVLNDAIGVPVPGE